LIFFFSNVVVRFGHRKILEKQSSIDIQQKQQQQQCGWLNKGMKEGKKLKRLLMK
jgi:hypothetical protein